MPATPEIHTLDLHFLGKPHEIAAFLIRGPSGLVLIETGPGSTLAALVAALSELGIAPSAIGDVLLTHIHLDHAGAAGWWAQQGARVHVHHLGAPHLIEPGRLLLSARRIYGDAMDTLYGEFLASPAHKVFALHDGAVVEAGGLRFVAHDTPGHARHHLVFQLNDLAFVGDLAGVRLPESPHVRLPTPPPEFDLEAWQDSVARMRALNFSRLYLTHFGPREPVAEHWDTIATLLPQYSAIVHSGLLAGKDREALLHELNAWEQTRLLLDGVSAEQSPVYGDFVPVGMSLDGLIRYWTKRGVGA